MLLDDFQVGIYRYEIFDTGGHLIKWTRINTTDSAAPIEIRALRPNARRREIVKAFED